MNNQILPLLKEIGVRPRNIKYYAEALTHPTYVNEHHLDIRHYQRLELMGDAVIELVVTEYLFSSYPEFSEGTLTLCRQKIVEEPFLAYLARTINLGSYLFLGKGEEKNGARDRNSLLCDNLESLFGAIYIDLGYKETRNIFMNLFEILIREFIEEKRHGNEVDFKDFKTKLQERIQNDDRGSIAYRLIDEKDLEDNAKLFTVVVEVDGIRFGEGKGKSKQEAEQAAAKAALEIEAE